MKKPTVSLLLAIILCGNSTAIAFDETDLKKLEVLNVCEECDLSGADLGGANLRWADLRGANLRDAKLGDAIICKTLMPWGEDNSGCK